MSFWSEPDGPTSEASPDDKREPKTHVARPDHFQDRNTLSYKMVCGIWISTLDTKWYLQFDSAKEPTCLKCKLWRHLVKYTKPYQRELDLRRERLT